MKPERGEQADDRSWCPFRSLSEGMELRDRSIGCRIEPASRSDDETLLLGKAEVLASDSVSPEIARTKNTGGPSQLRDFGDGFYDRHYLILHNVGDFIQVPTIDEAPSGGRSRGLGPPGLPSGVNLDV